MTGRRAGMMTVKNGAEPLNRTQLMMRGGMTDIRRRMQTAVITAGTIGMPVSPRDTLANTGMSMKIRKAGIGIVTVGLERSTIGIALIIAETDKDIDA